MIQVNTHEAKARLSYFLSQVEQEHERVKICRNGKPVALLIPLEPAPDPLRQHPKLMAVKIHEDPTTSLDDEDWPCDS